MYRYVTDIDEYDNNDDDIDDDDDDHNDDITLLVK